MALTIVDSSVMIAFGAPSDVHHARATALLADALEVGERLFVSAVTLTEILVGAIRVGRAAQVEAIVRRLGVELVPVDHAVARRAAEVRARTGLAVPDACVVASALEVVATRGGPARVATFDERLGRVAAELIGRPTPERPARRGGRP